MEKKKTYRRVFGLHQSIGSWLEDEGVLHPKAWAYIDELETRYWNGEV